MGCRRGFTCLSVLRVRKMDARKACGLTVNEGCSSGSRTMSEVI